MFLRRYLIPLGLAALLITACASQSTSVSSPPPATALPSAPSADITPELSTPSKPPASSTSNVPLRGATSTLVDPMELVDPTEPVDPADTFGADLEETALGHNERLVRELSPRQSATERELKAAEFLAKEFGALGYSTEIQPFEVERILAESSSLSIADGTQPPIEVAPLRGSAWGSATGPLVDVGQAGDGDLPEESLDGKVALIQRGGITFQEKAGRVAEAGASAAIIFNNLRGNFRGDLGGSAAIPVAAISKADGARLLELLNQGPLDAGLLVDRVVLPSRNVIADVPGGDGDVVVLGGHYDTVPGTDGANDNSSGIAVLLTLAEQLAELDLPFRVRFIAFGSEELGLLGSLAYVDSLTDVGKGEIAAMLNFDALGSGSAAMILGSDSLTQLAAEVADELEISVIRRRALDGGDSDHTSFARQGIPVLMFTAPDFSRIHTPNDTMEFVEPKLLGDSARLALEILKSEGFPR